MSRSFKKYPIGSYCNPGVQKKFKRNEHQAERKTIKQQLNVCNDFDNLILNHPKEYGNEWSSPRDGKVWVKNKRWQVKVIRK